MNHHPKLLYVDTVRAFHFGVNFLVEVDIVLPEDMTLKEAHDIGEPLQQKLESLPEVERAFVHLDYEFEHRPSDEHKQVWIFWFEYFGSMNGNGRPAPILRPTAWIQISRISKQENK